MLDYFDSMLVIKLNPMCLNSKRCEFMHASLTVLDMLEVMNVVLVLRWCCKLNLVIWLPFQRNIGNVRLHVVKMKLH